MDELYEETNEVPQQLPSLDDLDYMGDTAAPFTAKSDNPFVFDDKALQKALKHIYDKEFSAKDYIEENLFNETYRIITDATNVGVGSAELTREFRSKLDYNNAVFSAFKVHRMQNDIAENLLDENGDLRSFKQWSEAVQPMVSHHVDNWLRTEYNTASRRAQLAADWQRFEQYADILPNLQWIKSTSANPGEDHRIFWGTILPLDSEFWDYHRPGDRWNCKCGLEATDEEPTGEPNYSKSPKDEPQPGLDNNPGKDGKLFSDSHPYVANAYDGADAAVSMFIDLTFGKA